MLAETVVAVLALGRLGAIYTPIFSGYAAPAIAARLADCEAPVLITADGFLRRGALGRRSRRSPTRPSPTAPSVRSRRRRAPRGRGTRVALDRRPRRVVGRAAGPTGDGDEPPLEPRDVDPETPYLLIYTSGTTGRPKGAVHVHGGFPIKGAQDLAHQFDLGARRHASSGSPTSAG